MGYKLLGNGLNRTLVVFREPATIFLSLTPQLLPDSGKHFTGTVLPTSRLGLLYFYYRYIQRTGNPLSASVGQSGLVPYFRWLLISPHRWCKSVISHFILSIWPNVSDNCVISQEVCQDSREPTLALLIWSYRKFIQVIMIIWNSSTTKNHQICQSFYFGCRVFIFLRHEWPK